MANTAAAASEEQHFVLSHLLPSLAQRRLALAVVLALLVAFVITAGPLSTFQPGRIDAFVPAYATAIFVNDLITAVLLFNQFAILRSRALLAIASGYLFTALIVIPWVMTFPGVFTPGGLLGAGLQSTDWLFNLWRAGFPTFVIAYTLLKDADSTKGLWRGSAGAAILTSVAVTAAVVCAVTVLVTAGQAHLPRTMLDPVRFSTLKLYVVGFLILWNALALILLWIRRYSVLDLWLMVVVCAYVLEIYTGALGLARFSVGWYASRVLGFVPSILVLCVLLYEITTLYAQLLRAVLAQRREREARLMTGDAVSASIAHEIKQPLSAITMYANAGLRWLDRAPPNLDEAKAALGAVGASGQRLGEVIESVRAMFKKHGVAVQTDPSPQLPQVIGDRIQLQQVLLNLITNAIDSMANEDTSRVLSIKSEVQDGGGVMISVADTGKGIGSQDVDRIFNPLFSTKSGGMGMGLSICRSIIEAHGGRLWVVGDTPRGVVFKFLLRAGGSTGISL